MSFYIKSEAEQSDRHHVARLFLLLHTPFKVYETHSFWDTPPMAVHFTYKAVEALDAMSVLLPELHMNVLPL